MKKLITIGLLFISNLMYCQSVEMTRSMQIINDDEFSSNSINAFVLFKIRIIDNTNHYSKEQIQNGSIIPFLHIAKFDDVLTKSWDTEINAPHYIHKRMGNGTWLRTSNSTIYEWSYCLETKPDKNGYYFEFINLRNHSYKSPKIPIFRKILVENNKLYNFGTIEVTINRSDSSLFVKLLNNKTEKTILIDYLKEYYPNVYNSYSDKISDDEMKFLFANRTEKVSADLSMKTFYHYWSSIEDIYAVYLLGESIRFNLILNKKQGQIAQAHLTFNEVNLPQNFDIVYKSEWKKGEKEMPYGLFIFNGEKNKYFFHTTTAGTSGIEGTCNGTNEAFEMNNENALVAGKMNKKNTYKVEIRDKKAIYYVNNILISTIEMNYSISEHCSIGFIVHDKQKVEFDDFQIIGQ